MKTTIRRTMGAASGRMAPDDGLTIRHSRRDDAAALERLAQLDSQRARSGHLLLAEIGDELVAAVAVDGTHAIADPFRRTDHTVELLRLSLAQREGRRSGPRRWARAPRLRPRVPLVRA